MCVFLFFFGIAVLHFLLNFLIMYMHVFHKLMLISIIYTLIEHHHTSLIITFCQPKYIYNLKKTAERRKIEQDIIYERKVQRDMEKEGKDFSDKDTFLTSAYRRKLEERKQMEEELRREEEKEGEKIYLLLVVLSERGFHKILVT